jgi:hypothetical protein
MDMVLSKLIKIVTAALLASVMFSASAPFTACASPRVTVLAFGLFGAQSVFESEAKGAASIVAQQMGADPVVVRANTQNTRGGDHRVDRKHIAIHRRTDGPRKRRPISDFDLARFTGRSCGGSWQAFGSPLASVPRTHAEPRWRAAPHRSHFGLLFGCFPAPARER